MNRQIIHANTSLGKLCWKLKIPSKGPTLINKRRNIGQFLSTSWFKLKTKQHIAYATNPSKKFDRAKNTFNAKIALKLHWIDNYFILLICINFFSIFTIGFPILNIHFHRKRQPARGQTDWQTLTKWQNTWEQFFQYINGMNYKNCCYCLCKFY